jgi:hypothetical protein
LGLLYLGNPLDNGYGTIGIQQHRVDAAADQECGKAGGLTIATFFVSP